MLFIYNRISFHYNRIFLKVRNFIPYLSPNTYINEITLSVHALWHVIAHAFGYTCI
jgi:hypothetical protein